MAISYGSHVSRTDTSHWGRSSKGGNDRLAHSVTLPVRNKIADMHGVPQCSAVKRKRSQAGAPPGLLPLFLPSATPKSQYTLKVYEANKCGLE